MLMTTLAMQHVKQKIEKNRQLSLLLFYFLLLLTRKTTEGVNVNYVKNFVFGHQNPDTDAIGAAISFAYLQKELGKEAEAVALGTPNEETQYALDYFNIEAPRIVERAAGETSQVMLVDHNEFQQSIADIAELSILAVVDHHRIANFETADPLYYRAEPVGCTSTIIFKLFNENQIAIPKPIAGLMISAIISDTLLFKSPTCTQEDIDAATQLAELAEISLEGYGLDLLKAGTNLSDKTAPVLLDLDAKVFQWVPKMFVLPK